MECAAGDLREAHGQKKEKKREAAPALLRKAERMVFTTESEKGMGWIWGVSFSVNLYHRWWVCISVKGGVMTILIPSYDDSPSSIYLLSFLFRALVGWVAVHESELITQGWW